MFKITDLTPLRRDLFLTIIDGYQSHSVTRFLFHLDNYRDCDRMCLWLIENRHIGKALEERLKENKHSDLATVKWILKWANKESELPKILVGRDYAPK